MTAGGSLRRALFVFAALAAPAWAVGWGRVPDWPSHLRLFQLSGVALAILVTAAALWGREPQRPLAFALVLFGAAALARAALVGISPPLSNDIYRYAWDGEVWRHGINPFRYAPLSPHLEFLRHVAGPDSLFPRINYPEIPTIYPLTAQLLFLLGAWAIPGLVGLKALLCGAELATVWFLWRELRRRGRPARWVVLYAWHPLVLSETAANGHADALGALLLVLALVWWGRRPAWAAVAIAAAALVKWSALAAIPAARPRARWAALAILLTGIGAMAFLRPDVNPYLGLGQYLSRWRWNDSLFWVLMQYFPKLSVSKAIAAALLGAWVLVVSRREHDPALAVRSALGALLLLSPVIHPWYAVWLLPLVALAPEAGWLWLLAALPMSYGPWPHRLAQSQGELSVAWRLLEFGPAFLWWSLAAWAGSRARRDPPGPRVIE